MKMKELKGLLAQHDLFNELPEEDLVIIAGCGINEIYEEEDKIARGGEPADRFYLVREGKVMVEVYDPRSGAFPIQSLGPGEVTGWSWLFPPYRWMFDVRALEKTRVIALDGKCLREKCERNHSMGYRLMKVFAQMMTKRIRATRLQLLDVYGNDNPKE